PLVVLSSVYWELGRKEKSASLDNRLFQSIEAEVNRLSDNENALAAGGAMLAWRGDLSRAEEWARRAIVAEPDNWVARYNVACAYAAMNKPEMALEHLEYMARPMPAMTRLLLGC